MLSRALILTAIICLAGANVHSEERVRLTRTPDGGIQPQAAVDLSGVVHLVYYKGDARAGDLFYTRRTGDRFSHPLPVNSRPRTAIAAGTIRGAQLALGRNGQVHVIWNGNDHQNGSPDHAGAPLFYTRLNEQRTAFEPQRDLITTAAGLDGGSSVAADSNGNVYAVWHAHVPGGPTGEKGRGIFVRKSTDDGATFTPEVQVNPPDTGVCPCCGLRAFADRDGALYILYRAAFDPLTRDQLLLASPNGAPPFKQLLRHEWKIAACPMSSASFSQSNAGTIAAWETAGNVYWTTIAGLSVDSQEFISTPGTGGRKHPVAVSNARGDVLLAWTEGTGWQKGGKLAWQLYSGDGRPLEAKGAVDGVPVWSLVAAVPTKDGGFEILY